MLVLWTPVEHPRALLQQVGNEIGELHVAKWAGETSQRCFCLGSGGAVAAGW